MIIQTCWCLNLQVTMWEITYAISSCTYSQVIHLNTLTWTKRLSSSNSRHVVLCCEGSKSPWWTSLCSDLAKSIILNLTLGSVLLGLYRLSGKLLSSSSSSLKGLQVVCQNTLLHKHPTYVVHLLIRNPPNSLA